MGIYGKEDVDSGDNTSNDHAEDAFGDGDDRHGNESDGGRWKYASTPAIPPHPMIDPVAHKLQDLPPVSCESKPSLH